MKPSCSPLFSVYETLYSTCMSPIHLMRIEELYSLSCEIGFPRKCAVTRLSSSEGVITRSVHEVDVMPYSCCAHSTFFALILSESKWAVADDIRPMLAKALSA